MHLSILAIWGSAIGMSGFALCATGAAAPHALPLSAAEPGWPFTTAAKENFSTPVTGDLDGDGVLEVAFCSVWDGRLYVVDAAGGLIWRRPLFELGNEPPANLPSSVVIADVDDDPSTQEIVAASGYGLWGRIYVLDADGKELATIDTLGDVDAPPVVLDTDDDGTQEVYFGTGYFPVYHRVDLGQQGSQLVPTLVWSSPLTPAQGGLLAPAAAADLVGDGRTRLVVSTADEHVFALDPADGSLEWTTTTPGNHGLGAPVAIDLDGDGRVEILQIVDSGPLHVLEGRSGKPRWSLDTTSLFGGGIRHTPVAHDFDADGTREIVVAVQAAGVPDQLVLVASDGGVIWAVAVDGAEFDYSSPAVGDIDRDGTADIVVGSGVASPAGAFVLAYDGQGVLLWQTPQKGLVYSAPSLTDLDGDGFLETLFGVYAFEVGALDHLGGVFDGPLTATAASAPWPSMHRNANNNRVH